MNKKYFYLFISLITMMLTFLSSCNHDTILAYEENSDYRTAGDYIRNNFDLTLFYAALEKTNLLDEFNSNEIITIFAPNNKAFNTLGIYRASDFDRLDQDSLRNMLRYHVINRSLVKNDIPTSSVDNKYTSKTGKDLFVSIGVDYKKTMYVNGVTVLYTDVRLANGMLNIIDGTLKYIDGTVQDILSQKKEYSYFVAALKKIGYWDQLGEKGPFTIAAPSNTAFEENGITLSDIESMNPDNYKKRLFGGYLFKTQLFTTDLKVLYQYGYPFYGGDNVMIPIEGDEEVSSGIYVDSNNITYLFLQQAKGTSIEPQKKIDMSSVPYRANCLSNNGIVHGISDLLVLPEDAIIESTN